MPPLHRAAVALGSNVGDRAGHLWYAAGRLAGILGGLRVSTFIETEPVGVGPQRPFLNAAAVGETSLGPRELLDALLAIEQERGRQREYPGAPRTLDLDLILLDGYCLDEVGLRVPHPRFRERLFVLAPLIEIAPELVDPVTGQTVAELHRLLLAAIGRR